MINEGAEDAIILLYQFCFIGYGFGIRIFIYLESHNVFVAFSCRYFMVFGTI